MEAYPLIGVSGSIDAQETRHFILRDYLRAVIAAGGVATLEDVRKLYPLSRDSRLAGAVSGRALYAGTLHLEEANAWIDAQEATAT